MVVDASNVFVLADEGQEFVGRACTDVDTIDVGRVDECLTIDELAEGTTDFAASVTDVRKHVDDLNKCLKSFKIECIPHIFVMNKCTHTVYFCGGLVEEPVYQYVYVNDGKLYIVNIYD